MVATCSATRIGLCTGSWKMPVPTRSVLVRAATAARKVNGSDSVARHEVVMADGGGVEAGLLRFLRQLEGLAERIAGRLVAQYRQ